MLVGKLDMLRDCVQDLVGLHSLVIWVIRCMLV